MVAKTPFAPLSPGKFRAMGRLADADGRFAMLAVDQRGAMRSLLSATLGHAPHFEDICAVKRSIVEHLAGQATAVLIDPDYGLPAALSALPATSGLIVTIDAADYDTSDAGRTTRLVSDWSVEKVKRLGADAIKLLVYYSPRADQAVLDHQHALIRRVGADCARYDIAFMLEPLIYQLGADQAAFARDRTSLVLDSTAALADAAFQVDIYKLESPLPAAGLGDDPALRAKLTALFDDMTAKLPAPWVILSAAAAAKDFTAVLTAACMAGASGYLAGRSIWKTAAEAFPDLDEMRRRLQVIGGPYMRDLNAMTDRLVPASKRIAKLRPIVGPDDFPASYAGFSPSTMKDGSQPRLGEIS